MTNPGAKKISDEVHIISCKMTVLYIFIASVVLVAFMLWVHGIFKNKLCINACVGHSFYISLLS